MPVSWVPVASIPTFATCSLSMMVYPTAYVALFGPPLASFVHTCSNSDWQ